MSIEGALATVTLDRPAQLNAQTPQMWQRLAQIGSDLPATVRVVLIRGRGRSFSAGLDTAMFAPAGVAGPPDGADQPSVDGPVSLADLARMPPEQGEAEIATYQAAFGWLARTDLISIAAVQGHAVGAGFQLALACDLRLLADDAQLRMAEVPLGLIPDLGGTRRLVELVGYSRSLEICLTGRPVGAQEAASIGLANRVVPLNHLDAAVDQVVQALLAAPRNAVSEAKALFLQAAATSQSAQEAAERAAQHRLLRELAGFADS